MNKLVLVSLALGMFAIGCITSSSTDEKTEPTQTAQDDTQQVADGPQVNVTVDQNTVSKTNTDKGSSGDPQ